MFLSIMFGGISICADEEKTFGIIDKLQIRDKTVELYH